MCKEHTTESLEDRILGVLNASSTRKEEILAALVALESEVRNLATSTDIIKSTRLSLSDIAQNLHSIRKENCHISSLAKLFERAKELAESDDLTDTAREQLSSLTERLGDLAEKAGTIPLGYISKEEIDQAMRADATVVDLASRRRTRLTNDSPGAS
jgi:hypothetical protein